MKTEIKKVDDTIREVNIEVEGDIVKNKFEDVFKEVSKNAKVQGFRPGHAPRELIEKSYSSHVHEQVIKELVPDIYNKAIDAEKLDVIELPQISNVKLDKNKLSFKATVEVSPEIKLGKYRGLSIDYKNISVSEDDLKRGFDSLKESRKADVVDDNFARSLGYPSLATLKDTIQKQIFIQKDNLEHQRIENKIIEGLTKDLEFKLPKMLVSRQLDDLVRHAKVDLAMKGMPRDKIEEQEKELIKNLEPEAEKQVKVYLVLAEIAKKENIPVDDHMPRKVMEFLLREANWDIKQEN